jgi:hypothetical protein
LYSFNDISPPLILGFSENTKNKPEKGPKNKNGGMNQRFFLSPIHCIQKSLSRITVFTSAISGNIFNF